MGWAVLGFYSPGFSQNGFWVLGQSSTAPTSLGPWTAPAPSLTISVSYVITEMHCKSDCDLVGSGLGEAVPRPDSRAGDRSIGT
ncbi:hypothetical protein PGT21_030808 [Puccinia graminis f. sp. tritici]|uniref:Uncharacterized protein n=1 Tax=Puccinia graminis f. sp. tritici TaxID=56615 RepID=A0A5B0R294_PUCGR|nr:hypothetical protein PGT21_030808 [Puccinia graminis f. sp. tritici]